MNEATASVEQSETTSVGVPEYIGRRIAELKAERTRNQLAVTLIDARIAELESLSAKLTPEG